MTTILITQPLSSAVLDQWRAALGQGADVRMLATRDADAFAAAAGDVEVIANVFLPIDARALSHAPWLRFIQQMSVGYDHLDLAAIAARGILAANIPGANAEAVAEHTILLMLALIKRFLAAEGSARGNSWDPRSVRFTWAFVGHPVCISIEAAGSRPKGIHLRPTGRWNAARSGRLGAAPARGRADRLAGMRNWISASNRQGHGGRWAGPGAGCRCRLPLRLMRIGRTAVRPARHTPPTVIVGVHGRAADPARRGPFPQYEVSAPPARQVAAHQVAAHQA